MSENYGVEHSSQMQGFEEKRKQTRFKKYGIKNFNNIEKRNKTNFEKYGVENPMHIIKSFEKMQRNSRIIKPFRNTNIWYQGSYELDFLIKYYDKFPDIQRGISIKYIYEGKNKIYHPDFYIPSKNLIIECKSTYYFKKDIDIIKEKATISNGFNYIMIRDKDYSSFNLSNNSSSSLSSSTESSLVISAKSSNDSISGN